MFVRRRLRLTTGCFCFFAAVAFALDNGVAKTPPLGWSNWNFWANHINESIFLDTSDFLKKAGFLAAGYSCT